MVRIKLDGFLDVPADAGSVAQVLEEDPTLSSFILGDDHFDAAGLFFLSF